MKAVALARSGDAPRALQVITTSVNEAEVAGYLFDLAAGLGIRAALAPLAGQEPVENDESRSSHNLFASLGVVDPPTLGPDAGLTTHSAGSSGRGVQPKGVERCQDTVEFVSESSGRR